MFAKTLVVISLDIISDYNNVIALNEVAIIPDLRNVLADDSSCCVV